MAVYGKFWFSFLYFVGVTFVGAFTGDHHIDPSEGVAIGIAVCTAALTYLVPLVPSAPWIKTAVSAVLAGLQVAVTVILGGIDGNDVLLIAAAVASVLGITVAPAVSVKTATAVGWGSDSPTRA